MFVVFVDDATSVKPDFAVHLLKSWLSLTVLQYDVGHLAKTWRAATSECTGPIALNVYIACHSIEAPGGRWEESGGSDKH